MVNNNILDNYLNLIKADNKLMNDLCSEIGDLNAGVWSGKSSVKAKLYFDDYNTKYNALINKLTGVLRINLLVNEYNKISTQKKAIDQQKRNKYLSTANTSFANDPFYKSQITRELSDLTNKSNELNNTLVSYENEINSLVGW